MNKKKHRLLKQLVKKTTTLTVNYKSAVVRGIFKNQQLPQTIRTFVKQKIQTRYTSICSQHNVCSLTGRQRGVNTRVCLSRHQINRLTKFGFFQDFKRFS